jgi:hypothetical protein
MTTSDLQHDTIIAAMKAAKSRNNESAMNIYNNEKVKMFHAETGKCEVSIRESLHHLLLNYEYEAIELERVINILNNIK